ncbi:MerR family transcriptional regulator [Candidatus Leptofilum sp.]|uniref:MerR family transcriptional regulator n=1 Tax=Candidatus Leptofilum sp. TaxID=3241576 RepID=UPI003B5937D6
MDKTVSIQVCAERTQLSRSTLRYYERIGLTPPIERDQHGHRRYSEANIEWINFVNCMRQTGMPLRAIRAFGELHFGNGSPHGRLAILVEHQQRMKAQQAELAKALEFIEKKIGRFHQGIAQQEARRAKT